MNIPTVDSATTLRFPAAAAGPRDDQVDAGSNFERSLAGAESDEQIDVTQRQERDVAADESADPVTDQEIDSAANEVAADTTTSDPIIGEGDEDTAVSKSDDKPSIEQALVAALADGSSSVAVEQSGAGEPARSGALSQVAPLPVTDGQAQHALVNPLPPVADQSTTGKGAGNSDSGQLSGQQGRAQTPSPQTAATSSSLPTTGNFSVTANASSATSLLPGVAPGPAAAAPPTSAPQQALPPAPLTGPDDQANIARVVRGISNAVQQNGGTVTLRLQPPELGVVRIELQITDGTVRAAFGAQTESVRNLLSHQMNQLRHALEAQGIQVERLHVQSMPSSDTASGTDRQFGEAPTDGRSRGAFGQSTSEGDTAQDQEASHTDDADPPGSFIAALNAVA